MLKSQIQQISKSKTGITLKFSDADIIFGYRSHDSNFYLVNIIILMTKIFIFRCSRDSVTPNLEHLKMKVNTLYQEQEYLATINFTTETFTYKWSKIKRLLQAI